jgi:hypothetical protein
MVGSRASVLGLVVSLLGVVAGSTLDPAAAITASRASLPDILSSVDSGLVPEGAAPDDAVTERQLASLATLVGREIGSRTEHPVFVRDPLAPVTRLRVIAMLAKLAATVNTLAPAGVASEQMPPDAALIPTWGTPYVATAVEQGWWRSDRPLRPRYAASWNFVKLVLAGFAESMMPRVKEAAHHSTVSAADTTPAIAPQPEDDASYTGLVLDARGLKVQRAMGPRIIDEDGKVLYPDPDHVPDMTYLQDHGMASYVKSRRDASRSGDRPLSAWVVRLSGPGHDDLVVSRKTARRIREAAAKDGFLDRWAVSILIDDGQ